jgi:hypothetical protein
MRLLIIFFLIGFLNAIWAGISVIQGVLKSGKQHFVFKGKVFKYRPSGSNTGIHELALDLGMIRVQISYPTLTILDEKKNIIFQKNAYLKPKELLYLLNVSKMIYLVMRTGICTL